jgi:phosphoribosylformylglycinamidine synthase
MNKRVFVERKPKFDIERKELQDSLANNFDLQLPSLRYFVGYDLFHLQEDVISTIVEEVLSEKNRDNVFNELPLCKNIIAFESLPGQFDQRADSAQQCIKLLVPNLKPKVQASIVVLFDENIPKSLLTKIKKFLINSVESREKDLSILELPTIIKPLDVKEVFGFTTTSTTQLQQKYIDLDLAMSFEDFKFIQSYFIQEQRNPSETEIRVLDTYWSDHCRHTTFETEITDVDFSKDTLSKRIEDTFLSYLRDRDALERKHKPITLMDIATINAKVEYSKGNLGDLEISEEINAASIYINVDVDGIDEKWLLMFKNETHNHPTEIEPFGGASTCIGGAIRDPLSGRSYVYAAMRVTGAADITEKVSKTISGKLPQSVISKDAARGYSSYGNQIGLATTFVEEIYHEGYKAKRMEIGAVVGAVKASHVRRESPTPGDVILLIGGKTGRDGIGGATGSSKGHTKESLHVSSAEVQKGNAPEERKIQRLFRNPKVTTLIKKSNDFGAGGISVAIGELADGLEIDLDKVPTKYAGINGTELAISESQERMAVVIEPDKQVEFMTYCKEENVEVTKVADVTDSNRLVMKWNNQIICNLSRDFINTSGVRQSVKIAVSEQLNNDLFKNDYKGIQLKEKILTMLADKNIASQQGLAEMFDPTIGRTTVLSPFGGKYRLTKAQSSIHKIPVGNHNTNTVSVMSYGFNPYISEESPYHGATYAVLDSMAKIVASGADFSTIRFTFQEYFEKLQKDKHLWSKPFEALLGAYQTLSEFGLPAIGGKDSMSGTYHDLTVPPTLVSFAITTEVEKNIISPEFKTHAAYIYIVDYALDKLLLPDFEELKKNFINVTYKIKNKEIISAHTLGNGGVTEALIKMCLGNKIGFDINTTYPLFDMKYGAIVVESKVPLQLDNFIYLGRTNNSGIISINEASISMEEAISAHQERYKIIYPIVHKETRTLEPQVTKTENYLKERKPVKQVKVLIPVFPGTNCEYDCEKAFVKEGAIVEVLVFNNQSETLINDSIERLATGIRDSNILMLAGGFSSGDEPDGSGKFMATILKNETIKAAINDFLSEKNLILGICNGFQALIKSGLLPLGEIAPISEISPTLFKNDINRHAAKFVDTKVSSIHSPWLSSFHINETHTIPMSHGEGKFVIDEIGHKKLMQHNQIAFQYVDDKNNPTYMPQYNPNGSSYAIEGIISRDGLILGKMGHSERYEKGLFKNIEGNKQQNIFKNGVEFIRKGRI